MNKPRITSGEHTGRRIAAALFFATALALACMRSGPLVYGLLYLSVLLPLCSAAYAVYVYMRLRVVQKIDSRAALKNQPVGYVCRLSNETLSAFTRIRLQPLEELSELSGFDSSAQYSLMPGTTEEIHARLVCRRRGVYPVGIGRIFIGDILGLVTLSFKPPVEYPVTVYPRLLQPDSLGLFSFEGSRAGRSGRLYETEPADSVRDYTPGDDPRRIHWKASAHSGTLRVRPVVAAERPSLVVAVDTARYADGETAIAREDNLLETLLAICSYCAAHGVPCEVHAGGADFIISSYHDISELYEWTCRMEFTSGSSRPELPPSASGCCALLTTGHDIPETNWLAMAADAGAECVLMEFGQDDGSEHPADFAPDARMKVIYVPDDSDPEKLFVTPRTM